MRRLILVPLLIVVAFLAICGGIAYVIYNNYMYYTTDDAQVNGTIVNISAPATGVLATLTVKVGDTVSTGQPIGTVTPASAAPTSSKGVLAVINVTSPISGTVVQVPAVTGQGVTPGLPIVQVTDLSRVSVIAYVTEGAINNISNGQSVDITVDAYSGASLSGHVQQIVGISPKSASAFPCSSRLMALEGRISCLG